MTDMYLCIDPGASQTKIVYQLAHESLPRFMLMPPDVEAVSKNTLNAYMELKGWVGRPSPSQQVWLQVGDEFFVVGEFASEFDPEDRLQELKYENALYKVLAAIAIIREKHTLNDKRKLSVKLAILLPANEYSDRQRVEDQLNLLLNEYKCKNIAIKVKLESFICRPEGSGLTLIAIDSKGLDWLQENKLGVLMFGHRNISAMYFKNGQLKTVESPLTGFSVFLDQIVNMKSGLERNQLASAIFDSLDTAKNTIFAYYHDRELKPGQINCTKHPSWYDFPAIQNLTQAKNPSLRQQELDSIVTAIEIVTIQYWSMVEKWLNRFFTESLDAVIVSGGAARFLQPEIETYFNCEPVHNCDSFNSFGQDDDFFFRENRTCDYKALDNNCDYTPIIWGAGIQTKIDDLFDLGDNRESLNYRLVDAYGLFAYLLDKNKVPSSNKV